MPRGKITLRIVKRIDTDSGRKKDKYSILDKVELYNFKDDNGILRLKVYSINKGFRPVMISRDETAFVRVLYGYYGTGDYCIQFWGKGKRKGFRIFWDGMIRSDKKFFRRKNEFLKENLFSRQSADDENHLPRHLKTKRAGQWHDF